MDNIPSFIFLNSTDDFPFVCSDGGNIYFGSYYEAYGGISKCPIGSPNDCDIAIPSSDIASIDYTYGIAVDDNYIYRVGQNYDGIKLHHVTDGDWASDGEPW